MRSVALERVRAGAPADGPLQHWQAAERNALDGDALPGYRRIGMGVLLVTDGGADWEYSWQPATGPRLHTHRYLLGANDPGAYEVSWTTPDAGWDAAADAQRSILASVRDLSHPGPTWAVPAPR